MGIIAPHRIQPANGGLGLAAFARVGRGELRPERSPDRSVQRTLDGQELLFEPLALNPPGAHWLRLGSRRQFYIRHGLWSGLSARRFGCRLRRLEFLLLFDVLLVR